MSDKELVPDGSRDTLDDSSVDSADIGDHVKDPKAFIERIKTDTTDDGMKILDAFKNNKFKIIDRSNKFVILIHNVPYAHFDNASKLDTFNRLLYSEMTSEEQQRVAMGILNDLKDLETTTAGTSLAKEVKKLIKKGYKNFKEEISTKREAKRLLRKEKKYLKKQEKINKPLRDAYEIQFKKNELEHRNKYMLQTMKDMETGNYQNIKPYVSLVQPTNVPGISTVGGKGLINGSIETGTTNNGTIMAPTMPDYTNVDRKETREKGGLKGLLMKGLENTNMSKESKNFWGNAAYLGAMGYLAYSGWNRVWSKDKDGKSNWGTKALAVAGVRAGSQAITGDNPFVLGSKILSGGFKLDQLLGYDYLSGKTSPDTNKYVINPLDVTRVFGDQTVDQLIALGIIHIENNGTIKIKNKNTIKFKDKNVEELFKKIPDNSLIEGLSMLGITKDILDQHPELKKMTIDSLYQRYQKNIKTGADYLKKNNLKVDTTRQKERDALMIPTKEITDADLDVLKGKGVLVVIDNTNTPTNPENTESTIVDEALDVVPDIVTKRKLNAEKNRLKETFPDANIKFEKGSDAKLYLNSFGQKIQLDITTQGGKQLVRKDPSGKELRLQGLEGEDFAFTTVESYMFTANLVNALVQKYKNKSPVTGEPFGLDENTIAYNKITFYEVDDEGNTESKELDWEKIFGRTRGDYFIGGHIVSDRVGAKMPEFQHKGHTFVERLNSFGIWETTPETAT